MQSTSEKRCFAKRLVGSLAKTIINPRIQDSRHDQLTHLTLV